ncbi:vesicle-associated protein 1-3 [Tanacetum coccineum]
MQAQKEAPIDMQSKDKFLLQAVLAPNGTTIKDLTGDTFNKEENKVIEEFKLRVVYIPANPPSPVPEESEEGSSPRAEDGSQNSSGPDVETRSVEPKVKLSPEALSAISRLTDEKTEALKQSQKLQQELELLRKEAVKSRSGGYSVLFIRPLPPLIASVGPVSSSSALVLDDSCVLKEGFEHALNLGFCTLLNAYNDFVVLNVLFAWTLKSIWGNQTLILVASGLSLGNSGGYSLYFGRLLSSEDGATISAYQFDKICGVDWTMCLAGPKLNGGLCVLKFLRVESCDLFVELSGCGAFISGDGSLMVFPRVCLISIWIRRCVVGYYNESSSVLLLSPGQCVNGAEHLAAGGMTFSIMNSVVLRISKDRWTYDFSGRG